MSLQDDYFDLEDAISTIPSKTQRASARRCWRNIKDRLHIAEKHEESYLHIMKAMSTLRYYLFADPKGTP